MSAAANPSLLLGALLSTLICAGYGVVHALGLAQVWSRL